VYEQGRLVRDFGSISMPWAPLHPVRTFINLHYYHGELHSFRQYDFFGQVGYEFCAGNLAGKPCILGWMAATSTRRAAQRRRTNRVSMGCARIGQAFWHRIEPFLQRIPDSSVARHCSAGILAGNPRCGQGLMPALPPTSFSQRQS